MVMKCEPSLMTMCLPWRTILNPAFSSACTARRWQYDVRGRRWIDCIGRMVMRPSDWKERVNIAIMRTFVRLREMLLSNAELARKLAALENKYDAQFKVVFDAIRELMLPPDPPRRKIGFHPPSK